MSEEATQTPASEGNPGAAPAASGSLGEGSGGGVPAGYVPQAALDQAESRRREMQSQLDRERAQRASLEEKVNRIEATMGSFDPAKVADEFTARFNQQQAIASARSQAREQFPLARTDVFDGQYQTPEELIAAAKSSHDAEEQYRASVRSDVEKDLLARVKEQHGLDLTPTPQTQPTEGEGGGQPPLTMKDLAEMPMSEFLKLDQSTLDGVKS